ncbi:MAG: hypothetical protein FWF05_02500 [Oscillospiraceae bacterium]|nr:hypothetical protein [Oscillospiraceae bacterium]
MNTDDIKSKLLEKCRGIGEKLKADKKLLLIVALGVAAVLLLLFSEVGGGEKEPSGVKDTAKRGEPAAADIRNYARDVEDRLAELVGAIAGAGKSKVMVTLENGAEQVYASNSKNENERSQHTDGSYSQKEKSANEYIMIGKSSDETGLIIKIIQPNIRGVAVVCEGADSPEVRRDVTDAVTAVLGISSAKVSVTKMGNGR